MKKLIIPVIAALFLLPHHLSGAVPPVSTPPIPADEKETIAIVQLQKPFSQREIQKMLASYPSLQLRHVFREALFGFSIKGKQPAIDQFVQHHKSQIISASQVNKYYAGMEENVKIIGGEAVRRYYDKKNNRLTGKGITVGVIDTGIDYTHPDLRRNYGGGRDLVDNDSDPMETKSLQDPQQATYHGTHVAGIIAGNGKIQGVAPEAKIIAYRALGPGGQGTTEQVLAAIEMAIKDKVDVLNLSLGNDVNGPDLPISLALNKAVKKGIVAVAASGNSGPDIWSVGAPGTASNAISVGASTPVIDIPYILIEESHKKIRIEPMSGSSKWAFGRSVEIIDAGTGTKSDLSRVKGKIALIKRGGATFTEKAKRAQAYGADGILIYNNTSGSFIGNLEQPLPIAVGSLSKADGEFLKRKKELTVQLKSIEETDKIADFSSRGPVTDSWEIKPDIVAPGVSITSTIPGGYLSLQGTSMAAPHVAGACALLKQAHPDWTPVQIKGALMNTAKPLTKWDQSVYHTYEQGAGRIQAEAALTAKSLVTPGSIGFGRFQQGNQFNRHKAYVSVENISEKTQHYSFKIPGFSNGVNWKLPLPFTLKPKEKKQMEIQIAIEPSYFKKKIQDGYIQLNAGSANIKIPYLYVLEEPDYPRVMGFEFNDGDKPGSYRYEVYLPGGAEEFGIALFNERDYRFAGFLDRDRNVKKGLIRKEIPPEQLPLGGRYLAKVYAKKANREDSIENVISIVKKN